MIWEAFKPESEPRRTVTRDQVQFAARTPARRADARAEPTRDSEFLQREGGIY